MAVKNERCKEMSFQRRGGLLAVVRDAEALGGGIPSVSASPECKESGKCRRLSGLQGKAIELGKS
jgi:hypothetical protein